MPTDWAETEDVQDVLSPFGVDEIEASDITESIKRAKGWLRVKMTPAHVTAIDDLDDDDFDETHVIRTCVALRAAYRAWANSMGEAYDELPAVLEGLKEEADDLRQEIADNPFNAGAPAESYGEAHSSTMDYHGTMDMADPIDQVVDTDHIDDIADAKS
jgi:hypothetical protein